MIMEHEKHFRRGMGTENVGPLLRTLVQMIRPQRILEVGAGYTTPFILDGLKANEEGIEGTPEREIGKKWKITIFKYSSIKKKCLTATRI